MTFGLSLFQSPLCVCACVHVRVRFPEDFDITSSHKLRSVDDMQFSFSYFYYMMSEPAEVDNSTFFRTYDTDETG